MQLLQSQVPGLSSGCWDLGLHRPLSLAQLTPNGYNATRHQPFATSTDSQEGLLEATVKMPPNAYAAATHRRGRENSAANTETRPYRP